MTGNVFSLYRPRAIWDDFVLRSEMKRVGKVVPETYLPILRLVSDDPDAADAGYAAVVAGHRRLRWWDPPRTSWDKRYGNFVRELEWACVELKPILGEKQLEALIVATVGERLQSWIGWMKPLMSMADRAIPGGMRALVGTTVGRKVVSAVMGLSSPIVGDIEVRSIEDGVAECYIPDCAVHATVSRTEPQTNSCLYGCKAACEALFGPDDVMSLHFDHNMPAFDCVMRVTMGPRSAGTEVVAEPAAEPAVAEREAEPATT